jgi:hypothetical protein
MRLTTYPERVGTSVVGAGRGLLRSWFLLVGDRRIVLYAGSTVSGVKRFRVLLTGDPSLLGQPSPSMEGGSQGQLVRNHDALTHVRLRLSLVTWLEDHLI